MTAANDLSVVDNILDRCVEQGDCWVWTGATSANGYGRVRHDGQVQPTHRVVYTAMVADIPDGLTIDHVRERGCTSKLCCNWLHMEPVTSAVNTQRSLPWRRYIGAAACPREHPFTPENTRITSDGRRQCRTCLRARQRNYDRRRRMRGRP